MSSASEVYLSAKAAWIPDPTDNPECHNFYASFAAVREVLKSNGITEEEIREIHNYLHHAVSWTEGASWQSIKDNLIPNWDTALLLPERPRDPYYYEWRPEPASPQDSEAVESRARAIFEGQFRKAFPGQRINSKLAKEKWLNVQGQAREFAREVLESEYVLWTKGNEIRDKKRAELYADWQKKCDSLNKKRAILDRIKKIE